MIIWIFVLSVEDGGYSSGSGGDNGRGRVLSLLEWRNASDWSVWIGAVGRGLGNWYGGMYWSEIGIWCVEWCGSTDSGIFDEFDKNVSNHKGGVVEIIFYVIVWIFNVWIDMLMLC